MTATTERTEHDEEAVTERDTETTTPRRKAGRALPAALLTLAMVLVVAGVILLVRADRLENTGATGNDAVVDRARTSEVIGQVSTALNQVLSYDYKKPQVARAAGAKWLTGDAPAQYRTLFAKLQQLAAGEQLTLVARVVTAGVTSLRGDTAQLLVFLDQQSTRASDQKSAVSAAQVQITAVHSRTGWRISELRPI